MQYIAPVHKASSTLTAFVCNFTGPNAQDLILNKGNRIEVHKLTAQGTVLNSEYPINGVLTCLKPVQQPEASTALLLCATTSADFFALSWSPEGHINTVTSSNISEYASRAAEYGQILLVEPQHEAWAALHAFHGLLRIAYLKQDQNAASNGKKRSGKRKAGQIEDTPPNWVPIEPDFRTSFDVRLPDYQVHAMTILHLSWERLPVVAILHDDSDGNRALKLRPLSLAEREFIDEPPMAEAQSTVLDDPGSNLLLPLKDGVLVIGEQLAFCYQLFPPDEQQGELEDIALPSSPPKSAGSSSSKGKGKRRNIEQGTTCESRRPGRKSHEVYCKVPLGIYTTYTPLTGQDDAFLIGDHSGSLLKVWLERDATGKVTSVECSELGHRVTSAPTALVLLPNNRLYVASHSGDAQVFELDALSASSKRNATPMEVDNEPSTAETSAHLKLVQRQTNLAPIVDFVVVENEFGQSHMVACSGCNADGSLRIISHGVGLTELASFDLENIQRVWALKGQTGEDVLVLGFVDQTTLLRLPSGADEEVEEIDELQGFTTDLPTLDAFNSPDGQLVHVTSTGIASSSGSAWEAPSPVSVAAHFEDQVLLGLQGGKLALVRLAGTSSELIKIVEIGSDASCLTLQRLPTGKLVAAVGLWSSQDIIVFEIPDLTRLSTLSNVSTFVIRSILVSSLDGSSVSLFAGLGDGNLLSFGLSSETGVVLEGTRKTVTLGTRPIVMSPYSIGQGTGVLVSSDRPTLITRSSGRTNYVPVNLKDINTMCTMSSDHWPNSLVMASPDIVRIGRIDDVDNLQIRNILLGEDQPRRITYSADAHAYGLLCVKETFDSSTGEDISSSSFKIVDEATFEVLLDYELQEEEQGSAVAVVQTATSGQDLFVIGCSTLLPGESLSQRGRLVVFSPTEDGTGFTNVAEREVSGTPFAIGALSDGLFAVTVNASIQLMRIQEASSDDSSWTLSELDTWGGSFIATTLATRKSPQGDQLLVGDALRSVTLLKLVKSEATGKALLNEVAREHTSQGIMAVQFIDDDHYIAADLNLNVFTMSKSAAAQPNSVKLQQDGLFHLGEIVTKFSQGSLVPKFSQSQAFNQSNLMYSTSSGSVGIINGLEGSTANTMSNLQRNMSRIAPALGGLDHMTWRQYKTEYRTLDSVGFVDGSLIQTFADLDEAHVASVIQGKTEAERLEQTPAQLLDVVEELCRAHC